MAKSRWISLVQITFWCSVLVHRQPFHVEAIPNSLQGQIQSQSLPQPGFQISPNELRRLRAKGLELMPKGNSLSSGTVSGEPSCDELKALWRYYRRNGRAAELTNQIPQFPLDDVFWGVPKSLGEPQAAFGLLSKGRNRPRFKAKSSQNPLYGKILLKQDDKSSDSSPGGGRRPMEQVLDLVRPVQPVPSSKSEPTLVLNSPMDPPPKTGIDKIRDILRDERIRESGSGVGRQGKESDQDQSYGKLILSPPTGTDGRVANKPRELMSPFERIRFGHTDELFNVNDDSPRRRPPLFPITKRRPDWFNKPILNRYKSAWRPFAMAPHWTLPQHRDEDSIIVLRDENRVRADLPPVESQFNPNPAGLWEPGSLKIDGNGNTFETEIKPVDLLLVKEPPLTVDERLPLCSDIKQDPCFVNTDCACLGHGLYRCYGGQCQTLQLKGVYEESSSEIWHPESLSPSQLGVWTEHSSSGGSTGTTST